MPGIAIQTGCRRIACQGHYLTDQQIRGIAASGGVIGIGYFPEAVCGEDAAAAVRAIRYTANLVGIDHVALGSDFDGAVTTPFDVTGLPLITQALMQEGFTAAEIARIMGGNVIRVLLASLPDE